MQQPRIPYLLWYLICKVGWSLPSSVGLTFIIGRSHFIPILRYAYLSLLIFHQSEQRQSYESSTNEIPYLGSLNYN